MAIDPATAPACTAPQPDVWLALGERPVRIDPITCEIRPRRVVIGGVPTWVRLENCFWDELADIALAHGHTTDTLIGQLHAHGAGSDGALPDLAAFLRVVCITHLRRVILPSIDVPALAGLIGLAPADH